MPYEILHKTSDNEGKSLWTVFTTGETIADADDWGNLLDALNWAEQHNWKVVAIGDLGGGNAPEILLKTG